MARHRKAHTEAIQEPGIPRLGVLLRLCRGRASRRCNATAIYCDATAITATGTAISENRPYVHSLLRLRRNQPSDCNCSNQKNRTQSLVNFLASAPSERFKMRTTFRASYPRAAHHAQPHELIADLRNLNRCLHLRNHPARRNQRRWRKPGSNAPFEAQHTWLIFRRAHDPSLPRPCLPTPDPSDPDLRLLTS